MTNQICGKNGTAVELRQRPKIENIDSKLEFL